MQDMRDMVLVLPDLLVFACEHPNADHMATTPGVGRSTLTTVIPHVMHVFRRWNALDPAVVKVSQLGSHLGVCAQSNLICCLTEARGVQCLAGGGFAASCVLNFMQLSKVAWRSSTW